MLPLACSARDLESGYSWTQYLRAITRVRILRNRYSVIRPKLWLVFEVGCSATVDATHLDFATSVVQHNFRW